METIDSRKQLKGVLAPLLTPFNEQGQPDAGRYVAHAKRLLGAGCTGLVPFGTTGEATSLGLDERRALLDGLIDGGVAPELLLPGTGNCSLPDCVRLTREAVTHNCAGVLLLPPFYYKGISDEGLFRFIAEVIEQVGDSRLRVFLYHIPPQAVIGYSLDLVARLRDVFPDIVIGLKDSSGDWAYTAALIRAFPDFTTFSGSEVFLLNNLRAGGAGCITATANVNAGPLRELLNHWQSDRADAMQQAITRRRELIQDKPMIPMLKHIVANETGDAGWLRLRPPLVELAAEDAQTVIVSLGKQL
jgi:4-hydroxy-tetrahydrodipicolinate synthase